MLEHLYKTLLISVISGSLLSMNPAVLMAASDGESKTTTDKSGVITATTKYNFEKIKSDDMMPSILMLAGAFIAGKMLKSYRPSTLDVKIAAAGGVAYIAAEVYSNVNFKGKISEMTVEVERKNDGSVNEEQIQRLEDLKKSYEEAKSTTSSKKKLQLASSVAFAAAAVVATSAAITESAQVAKCKANLIKASSTLKACISSGAAGNPDSLLCGECLGEVSKYAATYLSYVSTREIPKMSVASESSSAPLSKQLLLPSCTTSSASPSVVEVSASLSFCITSATTTIKNETFTPEPGAVVVKNSDTLKKLLHLPVYTNLLNPKLEERESIYSNYIEKGLNFLFPKAEAGWLPLLGLGTVAAVAFATTTKGLMTEIDMMMFVPRNRAITWGLLGGIALMASKSSDSVISKLDENIKKIDTILEDLRRLAKGVKAQKLTQQRINISTFKTSDGAITFPTTASGNTECMTGNNSSNCTPLANELASMPGFSNLPDSFKDIASQSVGLGDSLSGANGISGSALSSAASLGGKQNAIAKLLSKKQADLNKILKGKTTVQKEQDKLEKSLIASVKKSLAQKGMTGAGFMASIGSTPIDTSLAKKNEEPPSDVPKKGGNVNAIDLQAGTDKEAQTLKLDFSEQSSGEGLALGDGSSSTGAAKEYEMNEPEINGENGPSLFELISGRYIKSGYPKLLEEEPSKN